MNEMIKTLNPYEELDVSRNATVEEIRRSYRKKVKEAHPDAGGEPHLWERLKAAFDVLMDPQLRKTYDDTGRIEEDRPDNDRAAALQLIEMQIGQIINQFITKGWAPSADPRKLMVIENVIANVTAEMIAGTNAIIEGGKVLAFYADFKGRFSVKDPQAAGEDCIGRLLDNQIRQTQAQIAGLEQAVRVHELAIKIARGYEFKMESPYEQPHFVGINVNPMRGNSTW